MIGMQSTELFALRNKNEHDVIKIRGQIGVEKREIFFSQWLHLMG